MSERRDTSGPGHALEFEIWSDLIKQSQGALHVSLPLLDRGLDAVRCNENFAQAVRSEFKNWSGGRDTI
jgi:hypothetical protein